MVTPDFIPIDLAGMGIGMHSRFKPRNGDGMVILPFRNGKWNAFRIPIVGIGMHSGYLRSEWERECIPKIPGMDRRVFHLHSFYFWNGIFPFILDLSKAFFIGNSHGRKL